MAGDARRLKINCEGMRVPYDNEIDGPGNRYVSSAHSIAAYKNKSKAVNPRTGSSVL